MRDINYIRSDQNRSVTQSCLTLCNPMNRSTPGLPVHHQVLEFTQTHVHWVSDAIQPSHPLLPPSPPAPNPSQHQSFPMSQLFISQMPKSLFLASNDTYSSLEQRALGWEFNLVCFRTSDVCPEKGIVKTLPALSFKNQTCCGSVAKSCSTLYDPH